MFDDALTVQLAMTPGGAARGLPRLAPAPPARTRAGR
jgi:hypothetical protein